MDPAWMFAGMRFAEGRLDLSFLEAPIYKSLFFLDLFLVAWLLVAGPNCGVKWLEGLSRTVQWIFTRRFLVFLGQHSLHAFSFHILLVYSINIYLGAQRPSELEGTVLLLLGACSLYLPAFWHAAA